MSETTTTSEPAIATDGGGVDTSVTATAADTSTPTGIFNEGLAFREGWFNDVTDTAFDPYRSMAAQFKDLPTVFKSLHDTKAALSQRTDGMIRVPGKDATPEQIADYRRATGVPDSPAQYQITPPAQLPAGIEFLPETLTAFTEFAHKAGISNAVANELIAFQTQMESADMVRQQAEYEAGVAAQEKALQQEWGPQWEQKNMLAKRAAATFGLGADHPALANTDVRKALARAAELISEDKLSVASVVTGILSPEMQAKDMLNNPNNPYYKAKNDPSHEGYKEAQELYMALMQKAYPSR